MSAADARNQDPPGADGPVREMPTEELALGYALAELDESGLRALYERLRQPGEPGASAAHCTWEVLDTTQSLRATLSHAFQDTVAHRVDSAESPGRDRSFLSRVFGSLGLERQKLRRISLPLPSIRRRWWLWLSVLPVLALALWAGVAFLQRPPVMAEIQELRGRLTVEGESLRIGDGVGIRPLTVESAGWCRLRFPDGTSAQVVGPARLTLHTARISLLSGWVEVVAASSFVCGLPEGRLTLAPGCRAALLAEGDQSAVGCAAGQAEWHSPQTDLGFALTEGLAAAAGAGPYPWVHRVYDDTTATSIALPAANACPAWRVRCAVGFATAQDFWVLFGSQSREPLLRLSPGVATLTLSGSQPAVQALDGAPLRERMVEISAFPGRETTIAIDGSILARPRLPAAPSAIERSAGCSVRDLVFTAGPQRGEPSETVVSAGAQPR